MNFHQQTELSTSLTVLFLSVTLTDSECYSPAGLTPLSTSQVRPNNPPVTQTSLTMCGDTGSEDKNVATISEDMAEWEENVVLSFNHPQAHQIMLADGIITVQDVDEDDAQP